MDPEIFYGVGAVVLLAVLVFAAMQRRRTTAEKALADEATRANYREEERERRIKENT